MVALSDLGIPSRVPVNPRHKNPPPRIAAVQGVDEVHVASRNQAKSGRQSDPHHLERPRMCYVNRRVYVYCLTSPRRLGHQAQMTELLPDTSRRYDESELIPRLVAIDSLDECSDTDIETHTVQTVNHNPQ
jgi:hypothetical protein